MQQTEKRGFNIIETSDAFSPQALNDNTRKIEAALDEHEEAVAGQVGALDARVTVLEGFKFAMGMYRGEGQKVEINVGFTPKVVLLYTGSSNPTGINFYMEGVNLPSVISVIDGGFQLPYGSYYVSNGITYGYLAFA